MSTAVHTDSEGPGDAELISAVRDGDTDAYGELFTRHVESARRLARQLVSAGDVDDLVSEAFAKVLVVLQRGGGPDLAFRAYLLTAVRRLHVDKIRATSRLQTTDDLTPYDPGVPFRDTAVEGFENAAAARAFSSLPERWQMVLWHTEVEELKPAEVAPLLGMSPNSVSALAYRAREGLRQAFITMHAQEAEDEGCEWTQDNLGAYIRNGCSRRDAARVEDHLGECRRCTAIYLELTEVNSNLRGILAPLVLGSAATGYLASLGGAGTASGGVAALFGRTKDFVAGNAATTAVAGVAAAVVIAGAVAAAVSIGGSDPPSASGGDAPPASVVPSTPSGSPDTGPTAPATPSRPPAPSRTTTTAPVDVPPVAPQITPPAEPTQPPADPAPTDPAPSEPPGGVPTSSAGGSPSPGPTTTPPTAPPSTTPPPTEPAPQAIDLDLITTRQPGDSAGTWKVHVYVAAPPEQVDGQLQIAGEGIDALAIDPDPELQSTGECPQDLLPPATCSMPTVSANFYFVVTAAEGGSITFTAEPGPDFEDPDTGNNAGTATLPPPPAEQLDLEVDATYSFSGGVWHVVAIADLNYTTGVPTDGLQAQLRVQAVPGLLGINLADPRCSVLSLFTLRCTVTEVPAEVYEFDFLAPPGTQLTFELEPGPGIDDPVSSNNTKTITLNP